MAEPQSAHRVTRSLASRLSPHRLLELPVVYRITQFVVAPGFEQPFVEKLAALAADLPRGQRVLDVGCGPRSWLPRIGITPIGLDNLTSCTRALRSAGVPAVTGSAFALPFADHAFDGVWCFGVLHHLTDDDARRALREMARVCRPGGYVVIWDGLLPDHALRRPIAWTIRKLDRGGSMRTAAQLRALFDDLRAWTFHHWRYTLYGLEGVFCVLTKPAHD